MAASTSTDGGLDSTRVINGENMQNNQLSSLDETDSITQESPLQRKPLHPESCDSLPSNGKGLLKSKVTKAPEYQRAALPSLELCLYSGVSIFLFLYIPWHVHQLSNEKAPGLKSFLVNGWSLFGQRQKDDSDDQWRAFVGAMTTPMVMLSMVAYIILGQFVVLIAPQFRKCFMLFYSVLCIYAGFGGPVLAVLLTHSVLFYIVCHTRRQAFIWIAVLLAIATVYVDSIARWQEYIFGDVYDGVVCIATCTLRLLCFGLEFCRSAKPVKPATGFNLFDLLLFNFYLPVLPYGPLIGYDSFLTQINSEAKLLSWKELRHIFKEVIRFFIWGFVAELHIHYLYFGAMTRHRETRVTMATQDINFIAIYHLVFFQLKTFVLYDFSRLIGLFDRIQAPLPPICIFSMHFFRDMWKYFDRGLNDMVTKYIYIPMGGSKHGLLRQSLAALMCFLFVAWWHGGRRVYFTWAILNWIGVQLEATVLAFSANFGPMKKIQESLSPPMLRRFYALCAVPNYLFLASSNLAFVLGTHKTKFFVHSVIFSDWPWNFLGVVVVCYCGLQVVNELERRVGKKALLCKEYL